MARSSFTMVMILTILLAASMVPSAAARVWRVEKDGSGDATVIQDAVDMAASGDTVRIGPGRFSEMEFMTTPGLTMWVMALVPQYELTFIGSGPETVLGLDEEWGGPGHEETVGITAGDWWGSHHLVVENIRFENLTLGIYFGQIEQGDDSVKIDRCEFYRCAVGTTLYSNMGKGSVTNCYFDELPLAFCYDNIVANHFALIEIEDCTFDLWDYHPRQQRALSLNGNQTSRVRDCEFIEGDAALGYMLCPDIAFERCSFRGQNHRSIRNQLGGRVLLEGCEFSENTGVLDSREPEERVEFRNCVFESPGEDLFWIKRIGDFTVTDCDLVPGSRGVVWCQELGEECSEIETLDMTNNYWGTSDPDSIQNMIHDHQDSETLCYEANWYPFKDESTPVAPQSLSDIKSLFR